MESPSDPTRRAVRLDHSRAADAQPARADAPDRGEPGKPARKETQSTPPPAGDRVPWFRRRRVIAGGAIVLVVALVLIALWWWHASAIETTDDAFLDAHIVDVSPQVAGQVTRVLVDDNELVRAGQPLVEIDTAQFHLALQQAIAAQQQAQTGLGQATASVAVAQASLAQANADLASAAATATRAQRDLMRYQTLRKVNPRAVARTTVDEAVATARSAAAR